MIAHALGLTRAQLLAKLNDELDPAVYQPLLARRAKHEPTAYITGYQPFMGLDFIVDRSVLIPRPETELLVEEAIKHITHYASRITRYAILDLGTGSGCIAISLAKALPDVEIIGIDSSNEALEIASKNAEQFKVSDRCKFILGNMFEELSKQKFDLIISNPPYIPTKVIETLQPEIRDWEPRQALDGGQDGLDHIRKILKEGPKHLKENGFLMLEFGEDQADEIDRLAKSIHLKTQIVKDLAGKDRIFVGQI